MLRSVGALSVTIVTLVTLQSFGFAVPALTILFITSSSFVVAYVSVRAYLRERLLSVLFLGCGALIFGCTSLIAGVFLATEGLDFSTTVFTTGALASGAFHLACASLAYLEATPRLGARYQVSLWIPIALFSVVLIAVAALEGVLPPFYTVGRGTTTLGQVALGAASFIFACSGAAILAVFSSSKSAVLYWYSLALGATAAGLLLLLISSGDAATVAFWVGMAALCLGGVLFMMSVLSAARLSGLTAANGGKSA